MGNGNLFPVEIASEIRLLNRPLLAEYVERNLSRMSEQEALATLGNRNCTASICAELAYNPRLTLHYSVRLKLVEHRATPQGQALKFVSHVYWSDLLRLSVSMQVAPAIRRAIDVRLMALLPGLTLGERIAAAKRCSREILGHLLFDPEQRVFAALLINARLVEDDLVRLIASERVPVEKLVMIADDGKWSCRYAIRLALVLNRGTPRAVAAGQLRYLTRRDLSLVLEHPGTSGYLRRCIEGLSDARHPRL